MFRKLLLSLVFIGISSTVALAQNVTCATRPPGDSSNACADTAFVQSPANFNWLGSGVAAALANPANGVGGFSTWLTVSSNTQLSALASTGLIVTRTGYATAGDSTAVIYTASGAVCSLNAGAGDGGSQVPTSDGKCWIGHPTDGLGWDIRQFGAKGDGVTDDLPAINAALATGKSIYAPDPTSFYRISFSTRSVANDTGWLYFVSPKQTLTCASRNAIFKVVRPPTTVVNFTGSLTASSAPSYTATLTSNVNTLQQGQVIQWTGGASSVLVTTAPSGVGPYTYTVWTGQVLASVASQAMTAGWGYDASPALLADTAATDAGVKNCTFDMDATTNNFIGSGYLPLVASNQYVYVPGVGVIKPGVGVVAAPNVNDGMAVTALIMADRFRFDGGEVRNGWDNDIMLAIYNWQSSSVIQSQGPNNPTIINTHTVNGGSGLHNWSPDFNLGAGIDVGTSVAARLINDVDDGSAIGFFLSDEGGGASSFGQNLVSNNAHITPYPFVTAGKMSGYFPNLSDTWHGSSVSGSGFVIGGNIRFQGRIGTELMSTLCVNCVANKPQNVGFWFTRFSGGAHLVNAHVFQPGLECFFAVAGTHFINGGICDQPNYLKGTYPTAYPAWSTYVWPQVNAVQSYAANDPTYLANNSSGTGSQPFCTATGVGGCFVTADLASINTTLVFDDLAVTGPGSLDTPSTPNWGVTLGAGTAYAAANENSTANIKVLHSHKIALGASGLSFINTTVTGSTIIIDPTSAPVPTLTGTCAGTSTVTGNASGGQITITPACASGTLFLNFPTPGPIGWNCTGILDETTPAATFTELYGGANYAVKFNVSGAVNNDVVRYINCAQF